MDGISQTLKEERIKIPQLLMPEVFDEEPSNLKTNTALQMRDAGWSLGRYKEENG